MRDDYQPRAIPDTIARNIRTALGQPYAADIRGTGGGCEAISATRADRTDREVLISNGNAGLPDGYRILAALYVGDPEVTDPEPEGDTYSPESRTDLVAWIRDALAD